MSQLPYELSCYFQKARLFLAFCKRILGHSQQGVAPSILGFFDSHCIRAHKRLWVVGVRRRDWHSLQPSLHAPGELSLNIEAAERAVWVKFNALGPTFWQIHIGYEG